jgi:hypothetical protein
MHEKKRSSIKLNVKEWNRGGGGGINYTKGSQIIKITIKRMRVKFKIKKWQEQFFDRRVKLKINK